MILVDTSIWIDYLREGVPQLAGLLDHGSVLCHPWVIGELALGNLRNRDRVLSLLRGLPAADMATDDEVSGLIEQERLHGTGIGYVDTQLLAATLLTPGASLWSADQRLDRAAIRLGVAFDRARRA